MKKGLLTLCFFGLWGACLYYSLYKEVPISETSDKFIPSDYFFLQRSFPDPAIDLVAYTKAMEQAKLAAIARDGNQNFDRPWRTEGPGNLGARVNTIAVHPADDRIIFAGYSGGGVFRTFDGGLNWEPVFDDQLFLAIGDIVFDSVDPNTIYVGTGDPNISGFPFLGDGLYKSTDLGNSWKYIGLEDQRIISKILVHPTNNLILYVATMGLPFEPNRQRGLYKSEDGGQSWQQILFPGEQTGVIDVVFDANDPNILFAAAWDRLRNNQVSTTSGPGARIYRSINAGQTWELLSGGLPLDDQSRIGLAMASDGVLAVYVDPDHNFQGLYKSINRGNTWMEVPTDEEKNRFNRSLFGGFGWYFSKIRVNPLNPEDITVLGVIAFRTLNGGQTWDLLQDRQGIGVHADVHDLVFTASGKILLGTDGGIYRFNMDGTAGEDIENIPATQIYRVAYNPHQPENYYMGSQDNGTAVGNALQINQWERFKWGGDGFQMVFHPDDPDIFYTESQRGGIAVTWDGGFTFESAREGIDSKDRRNWDQPYFMSPHDPNVLFTGTYRMYKSTSGTRPFWEPISPDLTNGPVDHLEDALSPTISAIDQSPLNDALLYAATTDANIWRSRNGGIDWEQLTGLPKRYFTEVVASSYEVATVYATVSGYRDNDNSPHIFRSDDRGLNWVDISGNLPPLAINCLKVIPGQEDKVLFAGTDGGVYGTINAGETWERVGDNMPIIAVYDLEWNQKENRLIAGTFARSCLTYPLEGIVNADNTLSAVNTQEKSSSSLVLYPNPVSKELSIEFNNTKINRGVQISLFNSQGKLVKQVAHRVENDVTWRVDVGDLPAGAYFVRIAGEYFSLSHRFIKI